MEGVSGGKPDAIVEAKSGNLGKPESAERTEASDLGDPDTVPVDSADMGGTHDTVVVLIFLRESLLLSLKMYQRILNL